jgi:DNA (cytosine-5)-methyltransferase 1
VTLRAATLFSGIGAPEVAMPEWEWPWHAEIDQFPATVMAVRHPNSINLGDVTAHDFAERASKIARPDVLVFGSPCQDFSVAGKRLGLDGARGNLALLALAIVGKLRPRWFVFENVPGLLSNWSGGPTCPTEPGQGIEGDENSDFAAFLGSVDELGYFGAWASLDAQYRGLAQRRDRLFFVGHSGDWRYPATVLFEPESLCGYSAPRHEKRQEVAGAIGASASRRRGSGQIEAVAHGQLIAGTITSAMRRCGQPNDDNPADYLIPLLATGGHGANSAAIGLDGGPSFTLDSTGAMAVAFGGNNTEGDIAGTLEAAQSKGNRGQGVLTTAVRRLTPRECERLQGFPDDYTAITYRNKPAADGPRYKALGNGMAVPVMRWILTRIGQLDILCA